MDKALNYLALARKGSLCELGEEPVAAAARAHKAYVILVAADASEHTWRKAKESVNATQQQCIRIAATKDEMGFSVGRSSLAVAAITDVQMAKALVSSLTPAEKYKDALAVLSAKAEKAKKRQSEEKAHRRNLRRGKK